MEYSYLSHLNFTADSELDEEILKNTHFNAYLYCTYFSKIEKKKIPKGVPATEGDSAPQECLFPQVIEARQSDTQDII